VHSRCGWGRDKLQAEKRGVEGAEETRDEGRKRELAGYIRAKGDSRDENEGNDRGRRTQRERGSEDGRRAVVRAADMTGQKYPSGLWRAAANGANL